MTLSARPKQVPTLGDCAPRSGRAEPDQRRSCAAKRPHRARPTAIVRREAAAQSPTNGDRAPRSGRTQPESLSIPTPAARRERSKREQMISSMTGFGRGTASNSTHEATVEIRTVNSRFCEVSIRGPRELNEFEPRIQRTVKDAVARGRVTINIQLDRVGGADIGLAVDETAVRAYRRLLEQVTSAGALKDEGITLEHMLRFQDIFVSRSEALDPEALWAPVSKALEQSLQALLEMRRVEGDALRDELLGRVEAIAANLEEVRRLAPERIPAARIRIRERLDEIIQEGRVDAERIEQEIVFLADRLDITEECVRLDAHLIAFREALATTDSVGRKLNFIAQEINREVNTIGSKANDPEIAQVVVSMKEDLEKIREQVENVE